MRTRIFGRPLSRSLEPWEEQLSVSYDDFCALMESARVAIGLALFHGDLAKRFVLADQSLLEHHNSGAILILAVTSDRLRDCFISAVLNKTTKEYEAGRYNNQKRTRYVTPFSEATDICQSADEPLPELLRQANTHAPKLYEYIKRRNILVHEIATERGRAGKKRLSDPQGRWEKRREKRLSDPSVPEQDRAQKHRRIAAEHEQRVAEALKTSMDWYKLLVRASSDIFEYSLRKYAGVRTA
jgi:hypothetical protein